MSKPYRAGIPVFMYHRVGYPVAARQDMFLNVSAESFRRQMQVLARLGYQARPFGEVVEAIRCGHRLPRRTFAVTFDDGYDCVGETAAPILAEFGFTATVFVVSGWLSGTNAWGRTVVKPEGSLLDWADLRRLLNAGWEIGGHTQSHPHLDTLDNAGAYAQILAGKEETEAHLGEPLRTFCYPYGHFNAQTPALVRASGFLGACTARSGLAQEEQDPFLLPRVKVAYRDGVLGLLYRLLVRPSLPNARPRRRSYRSPLPATLTHLEAGFPSKL